MTSYSKSTFKRQINRTGGEDSQIPKKCSFYDTLKKPEFNGWHIRHSFMIGSYGVIEYGVSQCKYFYIFFFAHSFLG